MAEILGIGVTHYPPLCGHDEWFGQVVSWALADPGIPAAQKDPANWPARMQFSGRDADFRSHTEFAPICILGRGIVQHNSAVDIRKEALCDRGIVCDDRVRMM